MINIKNITICMCICIYTHALVKLRLLLNTFYKNFYNKSVYYIALIYNKYNYIYI